MKRFVPDNAVGPTRACQPRARFLAPDCYGYGNRFYGQQSQQQPPPWMRPAYGHFAPNQTGMCRPYAARHQQQIPWQAPTNLETGSLYEPPPQPGSHPDHHDRCNAPQHNMQQFQLALAQEEEGAGRMGCSPNSPQCVTRQDNLATIDKLRREIREVKELIRAQNKDGRTMGREQEEILSKVRQRCTPPK